MQNQLLIDVRTASEFNEGHKEGAINISIEDIMSGQLGQIATLPKDSKICLYCLSGSRAGLAKIILNNNGYKNVENLGGLY